MLGNIRIKQEKQHSTFNLSLPVKDLLEENSAKEWYNSYSKHYGGVVQDTQEHVHLYGLH